MSILGGLPEGEVLRAGGQSLYVRRLGRGPRIVLLHGGPGLDHHVLLPLAIPLSRRFEVWLPDLPGHGRSHLDGVAPPDLSTLIERTTRWLEGLDLHADVLAGHSLGAWLVREMIAGGRVRPRAAVLLSCPVPAETDDGSKPPGTWIGRRRSRARGDDATLAREFLDLCAEDGDDPLTPEFVDAIGRSRLRSPLGFESLQGQFRRAQRGPLRRFRPQCPMLLLSGDRDRICTPAAADRLAAATEGLRTRVIEGAGHVPYATAAEPVERAIVEFIDPGVARR